MSFFSYLNAHPILSFVWFYLIVIAAYAVPVMIFQACVSIARTARRPGIVTEITVEELLRQW